MISLDSSIWVKYFLEPTEEIVNIIENNQTSCSSLVLVEVSEKLLKTNIDPSTYLEFIRIKSNIIEISSSIALAASSIKLTHRKIKSKFGIIDAIHYASSLAISKTFLTLDKDFLGLDNAKIL